MFYTYILYSEKDKKQYIGYTSNLEKRYSEHVNGEVFATKGRLPVKLIFYEAFLEKDDSLRREKYFKTSPGKRSLKIMLKAYLDKQGSS
ncbi:excinuclease ABC subunit C [Candidatus Daviesbacteria bacterium RIFCSPLOWO2_01_FULL_43_38]|nr:MAG: excinuclease ABC subunit C [Candidatus Daviesbacteria bacterium RIFCSPHIGHO2_01_FULL_43_17]OGE34908.1 MAG: excinuclease ABC subunit C [Candidatus Daviesbacteria bacterium RIFCSPHIGHO2_12_FULL_43_11]OGE63886.1 MAG: excinuclease ABC subunit C [Candidatus Daviesbacteria bacterium RIFCSPLOWO2_01_FULL_43_38]OGE70514.1 MAG: excinuclease ABC subunit C [Candidatus Daviesbacteria bacterium RIFCSPLOWO2_02_FULL_43_11]